MLKSIQANNSSKLKDTNVFDAVGPDVTGVVISFLSLLEIDIIAKTSKTMQKIACRMRCTTNRLLGKLILLRYCIQTLPTKHEIWIWGEVINVKKTKNFTIYLNERQIAYLTEYNISEKYIIADAYKYGIQWKFLFY